MRMMLPLYGVPRKETKKTLLSSRKNKKRLDTPPDMLSINNNLLFCTLANQINQHPKGKS